MERATIDVAEMIDAAIKAKQKAEFEKFNEVEETPKDKKLTWNVTPEQIARINAGDRAALDEFYFEESNFKRIRFCAYRFIRHNAFVETVVSYEDLMHQVYCDLGTRLLKFRPYDGAILSAIFYSFRYAAVGGADEIYVREEKECQKQPN